jgi:hypothetical protein
LESFRHRPSGCAEFFVGVDDVEVGGLQEAKSL